MVRLSFLLQVPLHELITWPDGELDIYQAYLSREPHPIERVEPMLAVLTSMTHNVNSKRPKKFTDFLLWKDAWKRVTSNVDDKIINLFSKFKGK